MILAQIQNKWYRLQEQGRRLMPERANVNWKLMMYCNVVADTDTKTLLKDRTGCFNFDVISMLLVQQWTKGESLDDIPVAHYEDVLELYGHKDDGSRVI